jgi:predicted ATPase
MMIENLLKDDFDVLRRAEHGNVEADTTKTLVNAFDFSYQ